MITITSTTTERVFLHIDDLMFFSTLYFQHKITGVEDIT